MALAKAQISRNNTLKSYAAIIREQDRPRPVLFSLRQILLLHPIAADAREFVYYELFLLELATGLRRGEITALQWNDLNFDAGELSITKQVCRVRGELVISELKTKPSIYERTQASQTKL